ncbi:F-box family protein, partial [Thalictrum thalictroides]
MRQGNQEYGWKDLPVDLLELIVPFLFLGDCIRFRLTCKSWISITPPLRSNCVFNKFESEPQQLVPWLMSFPKTNQGICKLCHPIYGDTYSMNLSELEGAVIRNAKYGWLLMSQGTSYFFFNPITMEVIKLPDDVREYNFIGMSFSSPPTSSDFVVFGFLGSATVVYRKGEENWSFDFVNDSHWEFMNSPCNPIFYDGVFYCLGKNGRLGLFNTKAENEESEWRIVESAVFSISLDSDTTKSNESFIVEYDGEILSVFVGRQGQQISIFKLDQSNMKWDKVESLGDKVLFLSATASMLLPAAGLKGIENRIYFP